MPNNSTKQKGKKISTSQYRSKFRAQRYGDKLQKSWKALKRKSSRSPAKKNPLSLWIQSARRVLLFFRSKLLPNQQMRKSFSGRKRVTTFFASISPFFRRRITNKNRCDKIGGLVSVKESFHVLCLAYYSERYLYY